MKRIQGKDVVKNVLEAELDGLEQQITMLLEKRQAVEKLLEVLASSGPVLEFPAPAMPSNVVPFPVAMQLERVQ